MTADDGYDLLSDDGLDDPSPEAVAEAEEIRARVAAERAPTTPLGALAIEEAERRRREDLALGAMLRRFLESDREYVGVHESRLTLDGSIDLSPEEVALAERIVEAATPPPGPVLRLVHAVVRSPRSGALSTRCGLPSGLPSPGVAVTCPHCIGAPR
jgi:hypothetical protein